MVTRTLTLTDLQAQGLAARLRLAHEAKNAADAYLSALIHGAGLSEGTFVKLDGITMTVGVPDE